MSTTIEVNATKSKFNKHLSNQYKRLLSNKKEKGESKTWPIDFNPFVSKKAICPESWAILSMNH